MAVIALPESTTQTDTQRVEDAVVIPFSRTLLGEGARYGDLPISADREHGSPVYLPGDPRLQDR